MRPGTVPLELFVLLIEASVALRIAGFLGSIPAAKSALVYLFMMVSKGAPFRQRNMVRVAWPSGPAPREMSLKNIMKIASILKSYLGS